MRISVFGLGYVGAVTAACLAQEDHDVIGVDLNADKVGLINDGESPIVEPKLAEFIASGVSRNKIKATTSCQEAVSQTDISLISVGTPSMPSGEPDLSYVFNVSREIAWAIREKGQRHLVVLRSTVPPGTLGKCRKIIAEIAGEDLISTAFNPEFLREGTAISDYYHPPYTIIGTDDPHAEQLLRELYRNIDAPVLVTKPETAEMVKQVANTWHAAKIGFANEIGRLAKAFGVDGREVMNIIVRDTKLNVSPAYMTPGFAYGGSCLPKDLNSLLYHAQSMNVPVPVLSAIPVSNNLQVEIAVKEILQTGARKIAMLGLAFKSGTDDLRESPAVLLIKRLIGEGCEIKIFDQSVYKARLMGTNLSYIRRNLPHFEDMLVPFGEEAVEWADLVVVTYKAQEFQEILSLSQRDVPVVDLAGVYTERPKELEYYAIAW